MPNFAQKLDELAENEGLEAAFEYDATHNPARIERFKKTHPEQREIAQKRVMNTSVEGYVYVPRSFGKWQPVTKRLSEIRVPTLIFLGEEDLPFYKATQILKDSIKTSEVVNGFRASGILPTRKPPIFLMINSALF